MRNWISRLFRSPRPTTRALGLEQLEARENPSAISLTNGTLQITGYGGMERVEVSIPTSGPSAGKLAVVDYVGLYHAYVTVQEFDPAAVSAVVFYGEDGNDTFTMGETGGRAIPVYAFGGNGNDTITTGAGADYLFGGEGNDVLRGGYRRDVIYGEVGDDQLRGDDGSDYLSGGDGNDSMFGGYPSFLLYSLYVIDENDELRGGSGNDVINGEVGSDLIYGDAGDDVLIGGDAILSGEVNRVYGGEGNDTLYGGDATDYLYGGNGNDYLYGLAGNDFLYGEGGADRLYGNEGNDRLDGGEGATDQLTGGSGTDTFVRYWSEFSFERDVFADYNTAEGDTTYFVSPGFFG